MAVNISVLVVAVNLTVEEQKLFAVLHGARHDEKLVAFFKRLAVDVDKQCRSAVSMVHVRRAQGQAALLADLIEAFEKR